MARLVGFEALEVDKVYEADEGTYDSMYEDTRRALQEERNKRREESTDEEEAPVEAPEGDTPPEGDDGTNEPGMEALGPITLELALSLHQSSQQTMIATEDIFTKENFQAAAGWAGQKAKAAGGYALDLTKQYGPVLLKHVYKGIVLSVQKTLKGLVVGTEFLVKKVHDYLTSYERFENQIQEAKKTVSLLKEQSEKKEAPGECSDAKIIDQLSVKGSANPVNNIKVVQKFFDAYQKQFVAHTRQHVIMTNKLIDGVLHEKTEAPSTYMVEDISFDGFMPHIHPSYQPSSNLVESYAYRNILPGDLCFLGFVPKKGLKDKADIAEAYRNSRMFFGLNFQTREPAKTIPYLNLDELEQFLDILLKICETGKMVKEDFETVARYRKGIQWQLKGYMRYLLGAKEKISIQESMAEYISIKTQLLDKVFVAGNVAVHDYTVRLLTVSLAFVKASIEDAR
jgi:hypothetical protein